MRWPCEPQRPSEALRVLTGARRRRVLAGATRVDPLYGWRYRGLSPRGHRVGRLCREVMTGRECREEMAVDVIDLRQQGRSQRPFSPSPAFHATRCTGASSPTLST